MYIFVTLYIELTFYISSLPLPVIVGNNQTKLLPPEFINCKFEKKILKCLKFCPENIIKITWEQLITQFNK